MGAEDGKSRVTGSNFADWATQKRQRPACSGAFDCGWPVVSELAIGGFGAMLALVVVFGNIGWDPGLGGPEQDAAECEAGYVLKNIGVLDGVRDCLAPGEWGVSGNKNAGDGEGVEILSAEAADDDSRGVANIGLGHLFGSEGFGDGNGTVEVIGVGCPEAGDGAACLGP